MTVALGTFAAADAAADPPAWGSEPEAAAALPGPAPEEAGTCAAWAEAKAAGQPQPQVRHQAAPPYVPPPLGGCGDGAPGLAPDGSHGCSGHAAETAGASTGAAGWSAPAPGGPADDGLPFSITTERLSSGLMATGIVFIPIGAISMIAGTAAWIADSSEDPGDYDYYDSGMDSESDAPNLGPAFLAVGGMMMVGGIIMTAVGAQKIPVITSKSASLYPTVSLSPSQATLSWTF